MSLWRLKRRLPGRSSGLTILQIFSPYQNGNLVSYSYRADGASRKRESIGNIFLPPVNKFSGSPNSGKCDGPKGLISSQTSGPTPQHKPTYTQVVTQNIPKWLKQNASSTVFKQPKNPRSQQETEAHAKAKYGHAFRPLPLLHNRRVWEHFLSRNRKNADSHNHKCNSAVQRVLR